MFCNVKTQAHKPPVRFAGAAAAQLHRDRHPALAEERRQAVALLFRLPAHLRAGGRATGDAGHLLHDPRLLL